MESQAPQKLTKQAARSQVSHALSSLEELKTSLGKKKFKRRMQKAEKIFSEGLPKGRKIKKLKTESAA